MADFFLANQKNKHLTNVAIKVFEKRGFHNPHHFSLSSGELIIYSKQNVDVSNYVITTEGSLFCVGTVVYKGLSYYDSLITFLKDYENNCIDWERIIGAFIILIEKSNETRVITDENKMYKIFSDTDYRFITTSFIVAAACTNSTFDKVSIAEQLMCGFISEPNTLVNEVVVLQRNEYRKNIAWLKWYDLREIKNQVKTASINDSVEVQVNIISRYMQDTINLSREFGSESGLSGGCDSRLIVVAANNAGERLKSVHTHSTSNIHDKEIQVVKQISALEEVKLVIRPTKYLLDVCDMDEVMRVLKENVYYFDARNADMIGAFSQTHTREYKKEVSHKSGVTYSGIGGEIYRNFYYTSLPLFNLKSWLGSRIFAANSMELLGEKLYIETTNRIINKLEFCPGRVLKSLAKREFAKRYFDSYRIPNALSNVVHANNQMSFFLAPFTEARIIQMASHDSKWQDHCGQYEGKIIASFSQAAAKIMTSKGYRLDRIPFTTKAKWKIRSYYPSFIWEKRIKREKMSKESIHKLSICISKCKYLREAIDALKEEMPMLNLSIFLKGEVPINNFIFTACAVYEILENKSALYH